MQTTKNCQAKCLRRADKGAILMVVLIVMIALLGLGMTGLFLTSGSIQMNTNINLRNQALVVAEAGIERARGLLNNQTGGWVPSIPDMLKGASNSADEIPTTTSACDGTARGAILVDGVPLRDVDYPTINRNTGLPPTAGPIARATMGTYTVFIRQDQADCRMGNYTCEYAPDSKADAGAGTGGAGGSTGATACTPPPPIPPNGSVVIRSEGVASDKRTRVVLEVTMTPSQGSAKFSNTPMSALCAAGANGCDDNSSVQNGIVVNSNITQNPPPSNGGSAGGGAGGAGGQPGTGGTSGTGGTLGGTSPGSTGGNDTGGTPGTGGISGTGGSGCGPPPITPALVPQCTRRNVPYVLLLLDVSWSMVNNSTGSPGPSPYLDGRFELYVKPAIKTVVQNTQAGLKWGLLAFPKRPSIPGGCDTGSGPVASDVNPTCAVNNYSALSSAMPSPVNYNGTPTDYAVLAGTQYLRSIPDANPKYLLLATDGIPLCANGVYCPGDPATFPNASLPSCGSNSAAKAAITAITTAASHSIKTYVVGIALGTDISTGLPAVVANDILNSMAVAGMTQQRTCAKGDASCQGYYPASDQGTLLAALNKIVSKLNSCVVPLSAVPPDPASVGLGINDGYGHVTQIHQKGHGDDANGSWDYTDSSKTSITLAGNACNIVAQGDCGCLEFYYGCGGIIPTPQQGGTCP